MVLIQNSGIPRETLGILGLGVLEEGRALGQAVDEITIPLNQED